MSNQISIKKNRGTFLGLYPLEWVVLLGVGGSVLLFIVLASNRHLDRIAFYEGFLERSGEDLTSQTPKNLYLQSCLASSSKSFFHQKKKPLVPSMDRSHPFQQGKNSFDVCLGQYENTKQ